MITAPDWYISDTHFGHANIIGFCDRPYLSVEEMDEAIIRNFRERVQDHDVVLWVGDVFFCSPDRAKYIMSRLPGRHILVRGNHDRSAAYMCDVGFMVAVDKLTLLLAGDIVRVQHIPAPRSPEWEIHGHTHSKARKDGRRLHVGVDAWDYAPVSRLDLEQLIVDSRDQVPHGSACP